MEYEIYIDREPYGKQEKRVTKWGSYLPRESIELMEYIGDIFREEYGEPRHTCGVMLELRLIYPIKGSYKDSEGKRCGVSKCIRESMLRGEIRPLVKPDCSNVLKLVEDALSGICYVDDSQIIGVSMSKRYGEVGGMELRIYV